MQREKWSESGDFWVLKVDQATKRLRGANSQRYADETALFLR